MYETLSRRALGAAAALAFVAGCSGNSSSLMPNESSLVSPSSHQIAPGMRLLPGPAVSGPIIVPIVPRYPSSLVRGWPDKKKRKEILFIADLENNVVEMYNPKVPNPTPEGSITTGINNPGELAVDKKGTLYVANIGNNTITEYPKGQTSPSVTIADGLSSPEGVAVDSKGDVFASNLGNNTVVGYLPGQTSAYETINFGSLGQPVGIAIDGKDNLWVATDTTNSVYEIPAGSSTPQNANLTGLSGPGGVAFGTNDVMYVSTFNGANVQIYAYGTTNPRKTIINGIEYLGPTLNGFTAAGTFFQSNQFDNVVGYKKGQTSPFSTITGLTDPLGIASSPLVKK